MPPLLFLDENIWFLLEVHLDTEDVRITPLKGKWGYILLLK